jgi:hypothetical protein
MPDKNSKNISKVSFHNKDNAELLKKIYDENKETLRKIKELIEPIQKKYKIDFSDLIKIKELSPEIPISIFNKKLSSLETIVKYLKENLGLTYHDIALLTGRDERNIWHTYNESLKKHNKRLEGNDPKISIPVSIIKNTKLSVLESIVWYLIKTNNLGYSEISKLLCRDAKTVWTCYKRALKKNDRK